MTELTWLTQKFLTEDACADYVTAIRWPEGPRCPRCGRAIGRVKTRRLFQCRSCAIQVTVTSGTVFHKSRIPLRVWFQAIALLMAHESLAARRLQTMLGIKSYRTAHSMASKIRLALTRHERAFRKQWLEGAGEEAVHHRPKAYFKQLTRWYREHYSPEETWESVLRACVARDELKA